jgi:catechol O-methyltransferase
MAENDPFAAFGSSDSDSESLSTPLRDASNGALAFHQGTEQALLQYVKNEIDNNTSAESTNPRQRVLQLVDTFCRTRHWMMHVGDEKGVTLQTFLTETIEAYMMGEVETRSTPFVLVEIGTYCGYSLIRMIDTLIQATDGSSVSFHLITVDVSAQNQAVAKEMARLAEVEEYVTFVQLQAPDRIPNELSTAIQSALLQNYPKRSTEIDFLFIDHEKELYLADLMQLEQAKLVRAKTRVCADNVVFFQLDNYRKYMQELANRKIVETRLVIGKLEYLNEQDQELQDGLGTCICLIDFDVLSNIPAS